ncbi:MAG: DUF4268 domain-containing protein, partial [Acidobacteriota bacterium]
MQLGRFQKVELRDCWQTEDRDFTPWLAKEENIEILSQEIGINLEVQGVEQNVGPFRADILCVDADNFGDDSKHYVLVENQLEITDHKHLGQLMTYAAGLDAVTLIWIASKFTEEHRAALDWLNRITDDTFRFFGIEIELYKIGESLPAPRFNIVAKPNDWSKDVKRNTGSNRENSEENLFRKEYWKELSEFAKAKQSILKITISAHSYSSGVVKFGKEYGVTFSLIKKKEIQVYFWIQGDNFQEKFEIIKANSE